MFPETIYSRWFSYKMVQVKSCWSELLQKTHAPGQMVLHKPSLGSNEHCMICKLDETKSQTATTSYTIDDPESIL